MKRLTLKDENGCFLTDKTATVTWNSLIGENRYRGEAVDRLAAIEDILGDEYDLKDIEKAIWCKKVVETAFSDDTRAVERLRELWFADQKGHCVVFDEHYPIVSEYYQDEDGRYIREASGVISEAEYMAAKGGALK